MEQRRREREFRRQMKWRVKRNIPRIFKRGKMREEKIKDGTLI